MSYSKSLAKLWKLMSPRHRASGLRLCLLMLIGTALETLGIGLVVPVLGIAASGDLGYLQKVPGLAEVLAGVSRDRLVIGAMLALLGFYAMKAVFLGFLSWYQLRFAFGIQQDVSYRLLQEYLWRPYTFHLQRNSAELIRNTTNEVSQIVHNAVIPTLTLVAEILVIACVASLLVAFEPLGAGLALAGIMAVGLTMHRFTKRWISGWGADRQRHDGLRLQYIQEGLGAIKDIKLMRREQYFLDRYEIHNGGSARINAQQGAMQQMPRLVFEVIAVGALAMLVVSMVVGGRPIDTVVPVMGLFAAASFRLMPSANRILNAFQCMRFAVPAIEVLANDLAVAEVNEAPGDIRPVRLRDNIALRGVEFAYPGAEDRVLRGIRLTIRKGTTVGFVGPSGAGKSTLVDVILGLLPPSQGSVLVDGVDIREMLRSWQAGIGYVPQNIYLSDDSIRANVAFGLPDALIDESRVWAALRAARLETYVRTLKSGIGTRLGERGIRLSGGQRQRVGIARALYHDPDVLVLDEATSALDGDTEREVMEAMHALKGVKTVLVVAHRMTTVAYCDRIFRLVAGAAVEQAPPDAVAQPDLEAIDGLRTRKAALE